MLIKISGVVFILFLTHDEHAKRDFMLIIKTLFFAQEKNAGQKMSNRFSSQFPR